MDAEDFVVAGSIAFLVVLVVFAIGVSGHRGLVRSQCLKAGYPGVQITWSFTTYCVKRVEQTDVVIPLSQVQ